MVGSKLTLTSEVAAENVIEEVINEQSLGG